MARPVKLFAEIESDQQRDDLIKLRKEHPNHCTPMRGHAIILRDAGYEVAQSVDLVGLADSGQ